MSKDEIVEELIKWFENYGVIIPDGSSATIKDFMVDCEIQSMAEELYEDFFADLQSQLAITEKALELAGETIKQMCGKPLWIGGNIPSPEPKDSKYFKDIAKEMLENE